jgi:hypothetical protein
MFWRLNYCAAILLALICTSSTFWIGSAELQQPKHHGDHKLSEQEHYKVGWGILKAFNKLIVK